MTDLDEQALIRDLHQRPLPPEQPDIGLRSAALGRRMRRRRRVTAIAITFAVTAIVGTLAVSPALRDNSTVSPAASTAPLPSVLPSPEGGQYADPVSTVCGREVAGDSVGHLDLTRAAIDRPTFPFLHMSWDGVVPRTGSVEVLFLATSADGRRSREFVVEIVDRRVVGQFVRDLLTGEVITVDYNAFSEHGGWFERVTDLTPTEGLGATFPQGSTTPLGWLWTWKLSITVDGVVVDSCEAAN